MINSEEAVKLFGGADHIRHIVGATIWAQREKQNMPQGELARRVGSSVDVIKNLEAGMTLPPRSDLSIIMNILALSTEEVMPPSTLSLSPPECAKYRSIALEVVCSPELLPAKALAVEKLGRRR